MTIINHGLNNILYSNYINPKKENTNSVSVFSNNRYKENQCLVNPSLDNFKANFISFKSSQNLENEDENIAVELEIPLSSNFLDKIDEKLHSVITRSTTMAVNANSKYVTGVYFLAALLQDAIDYIEYPTSGDSHNTLKPAFIKLIEKISPELLSNDKKSFLLAYLKPTLNELLNSPTIENLNNGRKLIVESDFDKILSEKLKQLTEKCKIPAYPNDGIILAAIQDMPEQSLSKAVYTFLINIFSSTTANSTNIEPPKTPVPGVNANLSNKLKALPNIKSYEATANFIGSLIASDSSKRIMLINNKGSIAKLVMQDFYNHINENKYPHLKPEKTNLLYISSEDILSNPNSIQEIRDAALADTSKKTVVFINDFEQLVSDFLSGQIDDISEGNNGLTPFDYIMSLEAIPNLSIVAMMDSELYTDIMTSEAEASPALIGTKSDLKSFSQVNMPTIGPIETIKFIKQIFKDTPEELNNKFSSEAIAKVVYLSHRIGGSNPGKSLNVINLIDSTISPEDKKVITKKDVEKFMKDYGDFLYAPNFSLTDYYPVSKSKLQDYILTKQSLEQVKEFIKNINTSKTHKKHDSNNFWNKTIITGSSAEDRLKLVQTIATETKLPILSLKTSKMVNYFYNNTEMPLTMVFNNLKLIAKDNPNKTAILYIEDINALADQNSMELTDTHQKVGINKLFQEIEKLQQKGLNIIVIGSTEDETQLNDEIYKAGGFNEEINIPSTFSNKDFRKQLISHYVKQHKIKFQEDSINPLDFLSEITFGKEKKDIENIIERARDLSKSNGTEGISRKNIKEAFARNDTGHIQDINLSDDDKKLLIAHEFGHYLTDLVMNEIAKDSQKPWALSYNPYLIDINTRKNYLGATFFVNDGHISKSLEAVFSELVSSFGGEAGESSVYNITSSSGISSDLQAATNQSLLNILYLGMGDKSGRISLPYNLLPEDERNRVLEQAKIWNHNAQIASKMITFAYKGFLERMMNEFYNKVGTGHIVDSEEFDKYFNQFLQDNKNNTEFKQTISKLKEKIPKIISDTINCRKTLTPEQESRLSIEEDMVRGKRNN